jgi:hypothetical protein
MRPDPITFCLTIDNFRVKFISHKHAEHLIQTLQALYTITINWNGTVYCGLSLNWNYEAHTVDVSMPGYLDKALHQFQHPEPTRPQHSPHAWVELSYGAKTQLTSPEDTSAPLNQAGITHLQEVIGTLPALLCVSS